MEIESVGGSPRGEVPGQLVGSPLSASSGAGGSSSSKYSLGSSGSRATTSAGIGLPPSSDAGTLEVAVPTHGHAGLLLQVTVPNTDGQFLLVTVPKTWQWGNSLFVPYEVSANGLVQHPLRPDPSAPLLQAEAVAPMKVSPARSFCGCRCCGEAWAVWLGALVLAIAPAVSLEHAGETAAIIGLVLSALLPSMLFMTYCYCSFKKSLLKKQMAITFFEAAFWLLPFVGFSFLLRLTGFFGWCKCMGDGEKRECPQGANCYFHDWFTAFIMASLFEETLKYCCIRRITYASLVVDAQSLFVYGGVGALGFATVENVLYVQRGGVSVAVLRACVSVPLHMSTGLLIGCMLGFRRFLNRPWHCPVVLAGSVLIHGFYDWFLFTGIRMGGPGPMVGLALSLLTALFGWIVVRHQILKLEVALHDVRHVLGVGFWSVKVECSAQFVWGSTQPVQAVVPQADVHALIWQGTVRPATVLCLPCCWTRPGERAWAVAGGERRVAPDDGKAYTYAQFVDIFGAEEGKSLWGQSGRPEVPNQPVPMALTVCGRHLLLANLRQVRRQSTSV